ncbi:hypothetical protein V7659_01060 [Neobacillus drentensis]|uniref:hypothetical protein n=1 Tax=Neobacillus drentensis TaxID=220684 RepID=UPI002FFD749C
MYNYNPYNYNPYYQNGINGHQQVGRSVETPVEPDYYDAGEYRGGVTHTYTLTDNGGGFEKVLNVPNSTTSSRVFVSITELKLEGGQFVPFQGAASMQVHNVVPERPGKVRVRGHIGHDGNITFRLSVLVF